MLNFNDLMDAIEGDDFEERPVEIEEFVRSEDYLNLGVDLSEYQYQLIRASTQIYKRETLHHLYGIEEGERRWAHTYNEVIFQLGKGTTTGDAMIWSPELGYRRADSLQETCFVADSLSRDFAANPTYSEGVDDTFRVTTRKGYEVTVNASHMFPGWKRLKHGYTYSMKKPMEDIPLAALRVGDILAVKRGWTETFKENWYDCTPDEARAIGYMIGDGTWVRNGAKGFRNPCFTNATPAVQNDLLNILARVGASFKEYKSGSGCWAVRINGITKPWMVKHGLIQDYHQKKSWNNDWYRMSDESLGQLINGVWATDGWMHIQRRAGQTSVTAAVELNSESLARGIHTALLKLGVVSKFRQHRKASGAHSATWRIEVTSLGAILRMLDVCGDIVGKEKICQEIREVASSLGKTADQPGIFGDSIAKIEYTGKQEVFGTTVEIEHYYNAQGILNCNSGKDFTSTIACAYVVYLLLCLRDPAVYYGKPPGDTFDIINIAINATQAANVFFAGFKNRITRSPWFQGRYEQKAGQFSFDKNVNVYSGHSEREAWEGYNVIYVVLDEISGFALESTSGNDQAKTAQAVYDMYRASVTSRFPDYGKLVLLSFPRFKGDFIQQRYDAVIAEKEVVVRKHTFKLNPDLPDGYEGNEFDIEWEEDHIILYATPKVYALKRPSWEVNPTKKIEDYTRDFYDNLIDSLSRFACMPPDAIDGLFKDKQKVEEAFIAPNGVDDEGRFTDDFIPDPNKLYFVHVDLAKKHDHCAVALAHIDKWVVREIGGTTTNPAPKVIVDAVRWWTPTKEKNVDFADVREYIVSLRRRGFNIRLVTFDRWRSDDMIDYLRSVGMRSEVLSVSTQHYTDLVMVVHEGRLLGPNIPLLKQELVKLRIMPNGKVDHPRSGSKDLADATCGAVYNAIAHTPRDLLEKIEVHTAATLNPKPARPKSDDWDGIIRPPKATEPAPPELADFLAQLKVIGN